MFPRITGNTLLGSEELIAYEIGYRAQITDKVSLDAALFYNSYDKLFTTQSGSTSVDAQTGALTLPVNRSWSSWEASGFGSRNRTRPCLTTGCQMTSAPGKA